MGHIGMGDMRATMAMAALALTASACSAPPSEGGLSENHGRYVGIGTYAAGELWPKIAGSAAKSPAVATTADDEHVIVVVDSRTGEVRECGDYTGVCIGFSPWSRALAAAQTGPVALTEHLAEVEREQETAGKKIR